MERFKKLTGQERKEYVSNVLNAGDEHNLKYTLSCNISVSTAFTWVETIQGHDYWRNINRRIENLN